MTSFLARTLVESAPKPGKPGTGIGRKKAAPSDKQQKKQDEAAPEGKKTQVKPPMDEGDKPEPKRSGLDTYDPGNADPTKESGKKDEPGATKEVDLKVESFKNLPQKVGALDNPQYFIISGKQYPDKIQQFKVSSKNILDSKNALLFFKGTKNELAELYFWFVSGPFLNDLVENAKKASLPYSYGPVPKSFFSEDTPFNSLKISKELGNAINVDSFRNTLNIQWNKARSQDKEDAVDAFPSFQMANTIDVSYLRFFNKTYREYELYMGDQVPNAGQAGYMYPLVSAQESENFKKFFQNFVMPAPFYANQYELADVDPDFKRVDPHKINPQNALIVFAKEGNPFKPKEKYNEQRTQLEGLEALAQSLGAPKVTPRYGNTGVLVGSLNVQFSKDFTKAIVWCGHRSKKPPSPAEVTKALPFVEGYDATFL